MSAFVGLAKAVRIAFQDDPERPIANGRLYRRVAEQLSFDFDDVSRREPIGRSGEQRSRFERQVRWVQQTMRIRGLIEVSASQRGAWRLTEFGKARLRRIESGQMLVAFSTGLGIAILGDCRQAFSALSGEPIHLTITSPPYPISKGRAYGTVAQSEYVDFVCAAIEPIVERLAKGGSIVLNIGNDVFESGSPARSLYQERLVLALHDRLGLSLMDRLVWHNPSKPPGPVQWSSIKRYHLKGSYEPLLWLSNEPLSCFADNRRVLAPHSPRHERLLEAGKVQIRSSADGAHRVRANSFTTRPPGRIPDNVISLSHTCVGQNAYKSEARASGYEPHGAPFPESLVDMLVRYLTEEGMLVVDPFGGSQTTAAVCEKLRRRWISSEVVFDYVAGGLSRFKKASGLWVNPDLAFI